eukprot:768133-Hanusia_phi.AAC.4
MQWRKQQKEIAPWKGKWAVIDQNVAKSNVVRLTRRYEMKAMGSAQRHKAKKGHNMKAPKKRAALARFLNRHIDQVQPRCLLSALLSAGDLRCGKMFELIPRRRKRMAFAQMRLFLAPQSSRWMRIFLGWVNTTVSPTRGVPMASFEVQALEQHKKSRFYKMRVKELKGAKPHCQRDAEAAVGLGVDNGPKLGRAPASQPQNMALEQ